METKVCPCCKFSGVTATGVDETKHDKFKVVAGTLYTDEKEYSLIVTLLICPTCSIVFAELH